MNETSPQAVLQLIREEHALYVRLEAAARRQRERVAEDDAAGLLKVLASRQSLTDELTVLSRKLGPVRRNWRAIRDRLSAEERAEADALISASTAMLSRVVRQDEEDVRRIRVMRQSTSRELTAAVQTRRAVVGYATASREAGAIEKGWEG
ncbi:MAG: hypothetical protein BroJett003_24260 [Planctomycetota bacterium]|nr:MAG: hypothetical protein BroJett003_24260 [Planctomycetota bacterium]